MAQGTYEAKVSSEKAGKANTVSVSAKDNFEAKRLIEAQYGPVTMWWTQPHLKK